MSNQFVVRKSLDPNGKLNSRTRKPPTRIAARLRGVSMDFTPGLGFASVIFVIVFATIALGFGLDRSFNLILKKQKETHERLHAIEELLREVRDALAGGDHD